MGNSQGKPVDLNGEVNLNHFRLLRVVGRGAFGKVRIVERKDTSLSFALKYIRKDEVVRSESVRNIIRERRMLEHVNHPFICNLRYSFQDIEYMYLVVDLMSGGDLRFHISRKTFTEDAVRFWIAELGCALRYVHGQGIIHRDVKPDNVLLDADGHVHLTDFNVASDVIPGKVLTSKSGTLAYLAPEVYAGKGYTVTADWWSLGVLFYECIYNKPWREREVEPVFVPSSDKTNFDATYDLEELLLEEAPLEARARRQKPREKLKDDATEKEIREEELYRSIERDFQPFDYTVAAYNKLAAMQNGEGAEMNSGAGQTDENAHAHGQAMSVNTAVPANPTNGNPSLYQASTGQQSQQHADGQHRPHDARRGPGEGRLGLPHCHRIQTLQSPTGGIQMTIDAAGSWSQLARQDATLPADANTVTDDKSSSSSGGVFSIFGRKKGRGHSPKPKERGVLGKEGARVVIG
ncbi:AGC/YANK protein kinase [Apiospora arundinis]